MKEYKVEMLGGVAHKPELIERSLNIAALADWELVCVSDGLVYYVRERRPAPEQEKTS